MKNYMHMSAKTLIEEIRGISAASDMSIAEEIGVEQSTVSRIRRGEVKDTASEIWKKLVSLHKRVVRKAA